MSTRSSLLADPDGNAKELAESVYWIPLQWLALITSDDIEQSDGSSCITTGRKAALKQFDQTIGFLAEEFSDFESFQECADSLKALLKKSKAKTIGIDVTDHIGMNPETFMPSLLAAVTSLQSQNPKCAFTVPARTIENPFTGEPKKLKAVKHKTTRDVLCFAASIDPMPDDEAANEQLIGYLF